jgi:hypothetical protein
MCDVKLIVIYPCPNDIELGRDRRSRTSKHRHFDGRPPAYSIRRTLKAESVAPQEKVKAITACRLNPTASLDADPIFSFPFWFGEKILCPMRF